MTQFRDLVMANENFRREAKSLNDRLDTFATERIDKYAAESSIYRFSNKPSGSFTADEVIDLGNDTIEYIHRLMWETATPVANHTYRKYDGDLSSLTSAVFDLYSNEATYGLSKAVSGGLHRSGRVKTIGAPVRGKLHVRLRPPTDSFQRVTSFNRMGKEQFKPSNRDEADIRRQQAKARDNAKPVTTAVDPTIIPLPEPNPDSVMEYVVRITACNKALIEKLKKVESEYKVVSEVAATLSERIGELEAQNEKSAWTKVVDKIATMREES